jgi:hypothetical protein
MRHERLAPVRVRLVLVAVEQAAAAHEPGEAPGEQERELVDLKRRRSR